MAGNFFFLFLMALTVSSINVRSVRSGWRRAAVFDKLSECRADVLCLQECGVERVPEPHEWRYGGSAWSPACVSRCEGVGILIKNPQVVMVSQEVIVPGRLLLVILEYVGCRFRLFNCYAPADRHDRNDFLNTLKLYLPGRMPTIIAGDLNCIREVSDRNSTGEESTLDSSSKLLNEMVVDLRLKDVAVEREGRDASHTYFSDRGSVSSRIDFIFLSEFITVKSYEVKPFLFSDHKMVFCTIMLEEGIVFGRGLWKLNTMILEEEEACTKFEVFFIRLVERKKEFKEILQWWDWVKVQIGIFFKKVGVERARRRKEREEALVERLHLLLKCKKAGIDVEGELEEVREERSIFLREKGKQIIFSAKVQDMEEGEQCSRFFFKKAMGAKKSNEECVYRGRGSVWRGNGKRSEAFL